MKIKLKVKKKMKLYCKGECKARSKCQPVKVFVVCMECGCGLIEVKRWIQINTGKSEGKLIGMLRLFTRHQNYECYCPRCDAKTIYDVLGRYAKQERRKFIG